MSSPLSPVVGPHAHHGHRRDGDHRRRRSLLRRRHPLQRPVGPRLWPPQARGEGRVGTRVGSGNRCFFTRDPEWENIRIRDEHPRLFFSESLETVFRAKNT